MVSTAPHLADAIQPQRLPPASVEEEPLPSRSAPGTVYRYGTICTARDSRGCTLAWLTVQMTGNDVVTEEQTEKRAWGGRFTVAPDQTAAAFTASIMFDNRMAREDVRGSIAHARMLGRQGIISLIEAAELERGLWQILAEVEDGSFAYSLQDEDIHTAVERRLREFAGPVQGKLHTARSRNDQVATDFRFWTKGALLDIAIGLTALIDALLQIAADAGQMVMSGYTHTQRAQPVLVAHHLLAYVEMFNRDLERLRQAHDRMDTLPLGSGALAGVTYPIDRESVARDLGFARISRNSLDAVSDRDFVLDTLYLLSVIQVHVSRLAEELVWWSSGEIRFVEISDAFSTGSSIMPQKKNADVAELSRGKTGRVIGRLTGMLATMKGLPLAYNSDMQEDKEALFDAVDTVMGVLGVFPPMVRSIRFNEERLAAAAIADFSLATDAADLLAKQGIAFREAHEIVGALVRQCIERGVTFADLSEAEWAAVHPVFAVQRPPLTALESISARDVPGGAAPGRVAAALEAAEVSLGEQLDWVDDRQKERAALFNRDGSE